MSSAVAIINWNSGRWLRPCVESLLATTTTAEILIIDNASTDASMESVEGFRNRVDVVQNSVNRGFAAAVNQAFQATSTPYVLILNPDVRAMPGAVQVLEEFLDSNSKAGAIGGNVGEKYLPKKLPTVSTLIRENLVGEVYDRPSLKVSDNSSKTGRHRPPLQVEQTAAAALMIRRDAYEDVGGFDERFYPAWYEDVDFCQQLKAHGWEIYFAPQAEFPHEGGYSAEAMGSEKFLASYYGNQLRYVRKHFGALGSAAVRASIAAGALGRMIVKPKHAAAYGRVFLGVFKG
jgi:GT2 family glycosyltransferase